MSDQPTGHPDPNQPPPPQPPPAPDQQGVTQPMGYPQGYPPPQGYPQGYPVQGYPQPGYPPGYPQQPPMGYPQGFAPPPPGYPQGYPHPQGYPQMPYPGQPMGYPPGYPMQPGMMPPQGFPPPTGAPAPTGVPTPTASPAPAGFPAPSGIPSPAALPAPGPPHSGHVPNASLPPPVTAPAAVSAASSPVQVPVLSSDSSSVPVVAAGVEVDEEGVAFLRPEGEIFHPPALTQIESGPPPNPLVQMWRKVGGGSLTLSLVIHAAIIIVGGAIVVSTQVFQKQVDFLPGGGTSQGKAASADRQHKVQQKKRSSLNKSMSMKKIVSNSQSSAVSLPDAPPDLLDVPDVSSMMGGGGALGGGGGFGRAGSGGGFGTGMGMGGAAGFVTLPPSMRSRCSTQERLEKLRQNGGNPECERAVSQSLEWLKSKQNEDGSWGKSNKAAYTGLALLCYLGRCETPESPFYGDNVMKGIIYLIELSKKNPHGIISEGWQAGKGGAGSYEHGIATYALGEMYTLARLGSKSLPGMREAFENGVKVIIENQNKQGSWSYGGDVIVYNKASTGEDLSLTGWQYQALKAAKNSGLKLPGLHSAIDKCCDYIVSKQSKDGGYGNTNRDQHYNQWSLTGTGTLGLQTLSKTKTASIKKSIKFLREFITAEPLDWNKNCNLYCWYYYTQAFFQAGGDDWKFYNEQFLPQILAAQQPDGSFKAGRANWPAGDAADPIYRQTLCTLQLEVYYRYLKVADRDEDSFFDK